ncbi:kinase-like protein [Cucurbitaria berberidis CBS 394.84]|uniref:non-specific serine/threonine protein kinase n=1 Tax=Cucurbitaria berberidis CBS 394.84 TaxID=1168544 RepID=A0A9P4LA02_9PLEO|nr:kinase-like protein [Cucurbitaria berberidis CBS 394.84]KAF1846908.1 kinase-like protein [Cucurbitaria berberidis CBS 394.84]
MATSLPPGINSTNIVGFGTTGVVAVIPCTRRVIKFPHCEPDARARCEVEVKVYERLEQTRRESCSTILRYHGHCEQGIVLEYAENGPLREHLRTANTPSKTLLLRWARQAAEALVFCHANAILHGDINCSNFFLDGEQNLKLGDFAGSSIDDSPATICYSTTHQLPTLDFSSESEAVIITKETEIFAFGSALYEMMTGRPPYEDKSDSEVERLFFLKDFPKICDATMLGPVITRCWNLEFSSMDEVLASIKQHEDQLRGPHNRLQTLLLFIQKWGHVLLLIVVKRLKQLKYRLS